MKGYLEKYKRELRVIVVAAGLVACYRGYQSYAHFEWVNVPLGPGHVVAMPSFRK